MVLRGFNAKNVPAVRANKTVMGRQKMVELTATKLMPDLISMRRSEFDGLPDSARKYMKTV